MPGEIHGELWGSSDSTSNVLHSTRIVLRQQAIEQDLLKYFTGKPCKHGHICERYTKSRVCTQCLTVFRKSERGSEYRRKYSKGYHDSHSIEDYNYNREYRKTDKNKNYHKKYLQTYNVGYRKTKIYQNYKKKYDAEYFPRRYKKDPQFRVLVTLRNRINKILRGGSKGGSAVRDLGCSIPEAMKYWEDLPTWSPDWTWKDHGKKFHMDHIKPLGSFDLSDREQFLQAAHYTNLQPLSIESHKLKTKKDIRFIRSA